jgi:hypothetical protein
MSTSDSGRQQRFFFVHIRKTAGTALRMRMINHFGEAAVYPTPGLDGVDTVRMMLSVDRVRERLAARGDQIKVVTAHLALCQVELFDGPFTTLTLLRDPVERVLSSLRDDREHNPAFQGMALEEIYDAGGPYRELAHNHMAKVLALTRAELTQLEKLLALPPAEIPAPDAPPLRFDRDHLELAIQRLSEIDAVGLQEHFEDFCDELTARFGWRLGEPERVNATAEVEVSDSFRARIAEDNALDAELYAFAKRLVRDRGRTRARREAAGVGR